MKIPLIKGDAVDLSSRWTDGLPQNMYAVAKPILGASGFMTTMPGLEPAADTTASGIFGPDRGAIWVDIASRVGGVVDFSFMGQYRVNGTGLFKIEDVTPEAVDQLPAIGVIPGYGPVRMAYSFNNLAIVADNRLFYYNPADGLREITDPEIGEPIDITWGDNVFILTDGESIYHSNPLDEEDYLPLDFGVAEFQPDPSLGLSWNEDSELIVFGSLTIEHLVNTGGLNFLFDRIKQKAQKIGIVSTVSKAYYGNTYYMLGTRENSQFGVYITESGHSTKISSIAIDKILNKYSRELFQNSVVEVVDFDGTVLCFIHLPDDYTLCYNDSIAKTMGHDNAWSLLTSALAGDTFTQLPYRGYNFIHDKQLNKWYCGDKYGFVIGRVNPVRGDQYGNPQECIMYSPFLKLETLSIDSVEIETVPGVSVLGFFYDPDGEPLEDTATMSISRSDDGRIYGHEWFEVSSERQEYQARYNVRRLGYVRNWTSIRFRTYSRARQSFASFELEAT